MSLSVSSWENHKGTVERTDPCSGPRHTGCTALQSHRTWPKHSDGSKTTYWAKVKVTSLPNPGSSSQKPEDFRVSDSKYCLCYPGSGVADSALKKPLTGHQTQIHIKKIWIWFYPNPWRHHAAVFYCCHEESSTFKPDQKQAILLLLILVDHPYCILGYARG